MKKFLLLTKRDAHFYERLLFSILAIIFVSIFAVWWFNPSHIPQNFSKSSNIIDVILFLLVSYVIWHPIMMDILSWSISSNIKEIPRQKPLPGLKVAFITTIVPKSEPIELLHKCLPAMVKANYKHDTWLLDEGNDEEVKRICKIYGVKHFSRFGKDEFNTPNGKYTKTKGGNHNSWYDSFGNNYDFVAQIDTDFVPQKSFLTKTLGYFRDPKVAFVGTPQVYANINESFVARGAGQQQYNFYGAILRGLSGIGMTLLIGANHVIRVSAFKKVNHYTAHITEDLVTGMKLHANGFKSVYVHEPLALGEGPSTWESYFNQQFRWAYGCVDILLHHSFKYFKKMSLKKSIYYFLLQQHYFAGIVSVLSCLLLCLYFIFGLRAASVDTFRFLIFYPFILIICWLMSVNLQNYEVERGQSDKLLLAGKIISIAAWPIWFMATISAFFGKKLNYKVTPKGEEQGPVKVNFSTFVPHFVLGSLAVLGIISSFITKRQNPIMLFWAASTALIVFSVPFADIFSRIFMKLKTIITNLVQNIFQNFVEKEERSEKRQTITDVVFLLTTLYISFISYISRIGFYSDDWSFIGNFVLSRDKSIFGLIRTATTANTLMRPVQNIYDAVLFYLFGKTPLGYQIVNSLVFSFIIILFYLVLKKLKFPRLIAITTPLIFAFLPNYSTDRFWYASFQVNLSILLFMLSTYLGLISFSLKGLKGSLLQLLSIVSLILSGLSYEIAFPLVFLNIFIFFNPFSKENSRKKSVFAIVNLIALFYLVIFKVKTTIRLGSFNYPSDGIRLLYSVFQTNFIKFGIGLPKVWFIVIEKYGNPINFVLAGILFLIIFLYLIFIVFIQKIRFPDFISVRNIIILSVAVFFLGYAIFLTNNKIGFSATGIDNRVSMAASAGIAFFAVGLTGFISLLMPKKLKKLVFCFLVSFFCTMGFLVIVTLSMFWGKAYAQSSKILQDIQSHFHSFPPNSTLILDGVCPYQGPGIVFESQWDLKGALQMIYHDPTIQADIVTPRLKVTSSGIDTQIYTFQAQYSYNNLYIYNFERKLTFTIRNEQSALNYFQKYNSDYNNNCPPSQAGSGVNVF